MRGYTEFIQINIKVLFTRIDMTSQTVMAELIYQEETIVSLSLDFSGNILKQYGNFNEVSHLQNFGMDEQFIIDRITLEISNIIGKIVELPYEFHIYPS